MMSNDVAWINSKHFCHRHKSQEEGKGWCSIRGKGMYCNEGFSVCLQISLIMLTKPEAHRPGQSPPSSPGFCSNLTAPPSALPPAAMSGTGAHHGLGSVEEQSGTKGVRLSFRPKRRSPTSLFSLALCRILSSMVPWQMSRYTVTCLVWPKRCARSMACWSTVGFQSLS